MLGWLVRATLGEVLQPGLWRWQFLPGRDAGAEAIFAVAGNACKTQARVV